MSRELNVVYTDCAGKPQHHTCWEQPSLPSTFFVQSMLVLLHSICALASFPQGTISSMMTNRFVAANWMTRSVLRVVWIMSWNCSFLSRSDWSTPAFACCNIPCFLMLLVRIIVDTFLTKGMKVMPVIHLGCFFIRSNYNMWASSLNHGAICIFLDYVRATLHDDRMYSFFH